MPSPESEPLIDVIGARRQLVRAGALLALGFCLVSAATPALAQRFVDLGIGLVCAGAAAMFLGAQIALRSINCPHCRTALLQYAIRHARAEHWLRWLLDVRRCPRCGFPRDDLRPRSMRVTDDWTGN